MGTTILGLWGPHSSSGDSNDHSHKRQYRVPRPPTWTMLQPLQERKNESGLGESKGMRTVQREQVAEQPTQLPLG